MLFNSNHKGPHLLNRRKEKCQQDILEELKVKKINLMKTKDNRNCPILLTSLISSRAGTDIDKSLKDSQIQGKSLK